MRRWLAVLMLVLLPAQFSWAMVGQYCAHETGVKADHIGHHEHEHRQLAQADGTPAPAADAGLADASLPDATNGAHADCEYCHLACGVALPAAQAHAVVPGLCERPALMAHATGRPFIDLPERPQWADSRTPV